MHNSYMLLIRILILTKHCVNVIFMRYHQYLNRVFSISYGEADKKNIYSSATMNLSAINNM